MSTELLAALARASGVGENPRDESNIRIPRAHARVRCGGPEVEHGKVPAGPEEVPVASGADQLPLR